MGDCFMSYHLSLQCHFQYHGGGPLIHDLGQNTHIRIHRRAPFNMQVGVFSFSFYLLTDSLAFPRSHESGPSGDEERGLLCRTAGGNGA